MYDRLSSHLSRATFSDGPGLLRGKYRKESRKERQRSNRHARKLFAFDSRCMPREETRASSNLSNGSGGRSAYGEEVTGEKA
ncbi:hypothetical protein HZH66_014335 [Vespula vulgaris]|uniref:Uncharacterized protein n=1 Tax=Vespula vulgaris TaxID=7454 RepID=A0A834MRG9_VESVU|nr:hypothetical protein HZH66_014335 [Vespula vulgaris]